MRVRANPKANANPNPNPLPTPTYTPTPVFGRGKGSGQARVGDSPFAIVSRNRTAYRLSPNSQAFFASSSPTASNTKSHSANRRLRGRSSRRTPAAAGLG